MNVKERIKELRRLMEEREIDLYYVPTADFHESEYVGAYFKEREFITGFTGSAGMVVISKDAASLFTDGRYFIQAARQIEDSSVELFRMGEEGVPTLNEYLDLIFPEGGCLGFDGRVVNTALGIKFEEIAKKHNGRLFVEEDLIAHIWKERPALSAEPAYLLDIRYTGESAADKIGRVREQMKERKASVHILTSLDDIAWLLNIRGNDARHFPIVLSFLVMTQEEVTLYVNPAVISDEIAKQLSDCGITLRAYENIYQDVSGLAAGESVLLDQNKVNYRIASAVPESVTVLNETNPTVLMKAIKNQTELCNIRKAHVGDGVAFTKFMYWVKTQVGKLPMTEITAADYLASRRAEQEDFLDLSFETIAAYEANAAMMHYSATPESFAILEPKGFLLVDSGGHYLTGSTDITRTIALGPLPEKQKKHFTVVARSMFNLSAAKFLHGCTGLNLDILARGPLWELGIDYRCGTGHGVGYLLNIHEAPNGFRWRRVADRSDGGVLEEGMVTTDEPGVYLEGEYGIRTENELVCRKAEKTEYGQFMEFETVTYAPIDLDAILPEEMSPKEKELLNNYHKEVYQILSPYMTEEESAWLKEYTREI